MSHIKNFDCDDQLFDFIRSHTISEMGRGSEGICLRGKDGYAYKQIDPGVSFGRGYEIENIITTEDIDLPSFAFPKELYGVNNELRGYKTILVENDLFRPDNTTYISTIDTINFKNLAKAYNEMAADVLTLSDEGILMYDFPFNVLFDGEKLIAVDTCGYKRVDYNPKEDNISSLNYSIEMIFSMWFDTYKKVDLSIENMDIESYLERIYKKLPGRLKYKVKEKCKTR